MLIHVVGLIDQVAHKVCITSFLPSICDSVKLAMGSFFSTPNPGLTNSYYSEQSTKVLLPDILWQWKEIGGFRFWLPDSFVQRSSFLKRNLTLILGKPKIPGRTQFWVLSALNQFFLSSSLNIIFSMIPIQKELSPETKDFIENKVGLKKMEIKPLPNFVNPHSNECRVQLSRLGCKRSYACLQYLRQMESHRYQGPSIGLVLRHRCYPSHRSLLQNEARSERRRFRPQVGSAWARKTLEERLDYSPMTRRAWERALQTNNDYQADLKKQIAQLKKEKSI